MDTLTKCETGKARAGSGGATGECGLTADHGRWAAMARSRCARCVGHGVPAARRARRVIAAAGLNGEPIGPVDCLLALQAAARRGVDGATQFAACREAAAWLRARVAASRVGSACGRDGPAGGARRTGLGCGHERRVPRAQRTRPVGRFDGAGRVSGHPRALRRACGALRGTVGWRRMLLTRRQPSATVVSMQATKVRTGRRKVSV